MKSGIKERDEDRKQKRLEDSKELELLLALSSEGGEILIFHWIFFASWEK